LPGQVVEQVRRDEEIIGLFCQIMKKRMFIIDDLEFKGLKKNSSNEFLSVDQIIFAAATLNQIAYNVFLNENSMSKFSDYFLDNLSQVLERLVGVCQRVEIVPDDFWVIDKELQDKCENLTFAQVKKCVSMTCVIKVPQVYKFMVRAKVFTFFMD